MVAGPKNKTGKKKQQGMVGKSNGGGLLAGDGVKESSSGAGGIGTRVYAGGARSGKARPPKELEKSRQKKGGSKGKGGGGFKSKYRQAAVSLLYFY